MIGGSIIVNGNDHVGIDAFCKLDSFIERLFDVGFSGKIDVDIPVLDELVV